MLDDKLKKLGLKTNEIKVYLSLFELGRCRANKIIESTGMHRNLVYTALDKLIEKDLVSKVIKSGVAIFEANSPESLIEMIESKKNIAEEIADELKKKQLTTPREIKILEGTEGIKQARLQVANNIKKGEDYCVLGASQQNTNIELEKFWPRLNRRIINQGGNIRALVSGKNADLLIRQRGLTEGVNAKLMNPPIESPMWLSVFRDIVNISIVGENPLTFSIKNQETADGFKKYFEYFWNQEIIITKGIDALRNVLWGMLNELQKGEEYDALGTTSAQYPPGVYEMYDEFHKQRIKKGVIVKMLSYKETLPSIQKRFANCGDPEGKISFLKEFISTPATPVQINMYKGKTYMLIYSDEPTVIQFTQPEIYHGYKNYFDFFWNQETIVDSSEDALKNAFYNMIDEMEAGEEYYVLGASFGDKQRELMNFQFFADFHRYRLSKKVKANLLAFGESYENIEREIDAAGDPERKLTTIKQWSETSYNPIQINLYNNKVVLIIYEEKPVVIYINKPQVYAGFKKYFDTLWNQESYVLQGAKALQKLWLEATDTKDVRWIGARGYFMGNHPELYKAILEKSKNTPGLVWKNIVDPDFKGHKLTTYPWSQTKYILPNKSKNPNVVWLLGDKIAITNWTEKEPVIFVSHNKFLVQSYYDYFDELWGED